MSKKAEDAVARVLTVEAEKGNMDVTAGWMVAEEGVARLKARGWGEPTLLACRKAGKAVMEFIRAGKTGVALFPYTDVTAGHMLEALDRTDDIPIMVPAVHMYRKEGNVAVKQDW